MTTLAPRPRRRQTDTLLPFFHPTRGVDQPGSFWHVPRGGDYGPDYRRGQEFAARFALYVSLQTRQTGDGLLGLIAADMDHSDASSLGYRAGFFGYLQRLIAFAARQTDVLDDVALCNACLQDGDEKSASGVSD